MSFTIILKKENPNARLTEIAGKSAVHRRRNSQFPILLPSLFQFPMSAPTTIAAAAPNGDLKLHHRRSPAFRRKIDPAGVDIPQAENKDPEFTNWSSDYTSIRDLIASSPRSCAASPTAFGSEIQIRNPLVKQAVCAYLQLTPSSADTSSSSSFWNLHLRRLMTAISAAFRPLRRCFRIIARLLCCANSGESR
ncbi:uncharacterized protein LOC110019860 [Phalaenopsis equestris]|uniref:uncharacterized protein LOC110019860 n=1 Tax=Phalaenopsis equestris TaxID=78828 RepID=UPI0009E35999|nr:uncharacterized protein LOC110019860 [Phalaenopsis equestris]